MMYADLRLPTSSRFYVSDASETGKVYVMPMSPTRSFLEGSSKTRALKGWYSSLLSVTEAVAGDEEEPTPHPIVSA